MTRTIDVAVEEDMLNEAMRLAGTSEPGKALIEALREYTRPRSQKDLIKYLGTSDGFYTSEELDRLRAMD
ncbi:MAG TPA: type II toxin-antitoxin system VapB family antitoxin [Tepidisphaeraceae bacterium]|nr:type II toxin-antitoxin system VapB family antitoxin [Tepidisphaeraceae bacterium]